MKCTTCGNTEYFMLLRPMVAQFPVKSFTRDTIVVDFEDGEEFVDTNHEETIVCDICGGEWPVEKDIEKA